MGAAGFEPAAAWSEAKYSVQAELSARTRVFLPTPYKSLDLHRFRHPSTHRSTRATSHAMKTAFGGLCAGGRSGGRAMTVNEAPKPEDGQQRTAPLELLSDDDETVWTAVPVDASGDERVTKWLSVETDALCDLEEWR